MNHVDAACKICGKPFRWLGGTPLLCNEHQLATRRQINSREKDTETDKVQVPDNTETKPDEIKQG